MSKILVFTDLHGDAFKMRKLEQVFLDNKCDKIFFLGDLLYHGPRNDLPAGYNPKEVISILKSYKDKFIWVKGNCDAEVDDMVMNLKACPQIDIEENDLKFVLVHGHHLAFDESDGFEKNSVVLYGHYHVFSNRNINGVTYIGVGSPSIPKDGYGQYAIINRKEITIYDINDNVGPIVIDLNKTN